MATFQAPAAAYAAATTTHGAPAGTFAPGTKVQVGSHRVIIEKYLSEGGFAHVYVVRLPAPSTGTAVLKRVAVPDKDTLSNMRNEVETMKRLRGQQYIVTYMDSHASQLKGGGYEVFLLMEYCAGGGLIDFMNTRLKNRLTEPEILDILGDTAEGVACMHYLTPPLLHRDLKVENILISKTSDGRKKFKLCDFGSAAPPRPAAKSAAEGRLIEDDVQRHTTLQYRSPEMIDVYRHKPIDEKSDIWALGVLLYKLCYYTTPFEEQGQMAILSASFKYPAYPPFSDRLKKLIATMLTEDPDRRPNIYQIVREVCQMRGKECPIRDIYARRTQSEARSTQKLPPRENAVKSPPMVGAQIEAPEQNKQHLPEVKPMRRGRPSGPSQANATARLGSSPSKRAGADPFAALDSKNYDERAKAVDELSQKYPPIDDFPSLQNKGKFEFSKGAATSTTQNTQASNINKRVTNALADEAFASRTSNPPTSSSLSSSRQAAAAMKPVAKATSSVPSSSHSIQQPQPQRSMMVSTGTMTSRPSSPERALPTRPQKPSFDIWPVPQTADDSSPRMSSINRFDNLTAKHAAVRELSSSPNLDLPTSPASSRPSLEGGRPSLDVASDLHRSRSTNVAPEHQHRRRGSGLFRRSSSKRETKRRSGVFNDPPAPSSPTVGDDANIVSDLDYLRAIEAEHDAALKSSHHRRSNSAIHNIKHASLPSLGGAKNKFAGRLGETFKRLENNRNTPLQVEDVDTSASTSAPLAAQAESGDELIAVEGDEKRGSPSLADDDAISASTDDSPEQRREFERRQLEAEERRVEQAAAAYRNRLANGHAATGTAAPISTRASAIQSRVKSLLDESSREAPVKRTAEGYGRYTFQKASVSDKVRSDQPEMRRPASNTRTGISKSSTVQAIQEPPVVASNVTMKSPFPRPSIAPKPVALRTGSAGVKPHLDTQNTPVEKNIPPNLMDESPEQAPSRRSEDVGNLIDDSPSDWEASFAKRYPRLSEGLVDPDVAAISDRTGGDNTSRQTRVATRIKDV